MSQAVHIREELIQHLPARGCLAFLKIKGGVILANTVTKEQIDNLFDRSEKKVETYWNKCTVITIQLPNGFTIVEHSACVDPANYDEQIGLEICERKIKDQLWAFEGYRLQCELGKL